MCEEVHAERTGNLILLSSILVSLCDMIEYTVDKYVK